MLNGNRITGAYNANTSVTLYRRCAITDLFIANQTPNGVTGFKIGTTNGGGEIYTAQGTITAFQFIKEINPVAVFDFYNDTTIYITATNWNGSSIGVGIKFEDLNII